MITQVALYTVAWHTTLAGHDRPIFSTVLVCPSCDIRRALPQEMRLKGSYSSRSTVLIGCDGQLLLNVTRDGASSIWADSKVSSTGTGTTNRHQTCPFRLVTMIKGLRLSETFMVDACERRTACRSLYEFPSI